MITGSHQTFEVNLKPGDHKKKFAQSLTGSMGGGNVVTTNNMIRNPYGPITTTAEGVSSDGTDTRWVNAGSLTAGAASEVGITAVNDNSSHFLAFLDSSSGNDNIKVDTNLTYNPSTNLLSLGGISFSGTISGGTSVSATNLSGNLTGTIQTAAQTNITSVRTLTGLTVDGNLILDSTSNYLHIKGALYDKDGQSGSADQVLVSTGTQVDWKDTTSLTASNSQKITIAESDTNSDFPITFSAAPGQSGGNTLLSDNQFTYNASANVVTAGTFSGSGASLTSLNASNLGTGTVADARLSNSSLFVQGMIMMYTGSTAPSGWAICNGQNGTPDLRDRFIVGAGSAYSIGNTGGQNSVTLTVNQIPAHTHTYERTDVGINVNDRPWPASNNDCDMTTQNTSSTGGGQSHENRPPYYALMFIVKL